MTETQQKPLPEVGAELFVGLSKVTVKAILDNPYTNATHILVLNQDTKRFENYSANDFTTEKEFFVAVNFDGQAASEAAVLGRVTEESLTQVATLFKVNVVDDKFAFTEIMSRPLTPVVEEVASDPADPETTTEAA